MTHQRIFSTALALLLGLAAAVPVQVHADDTEVYLLSPDQGPRPNILFILDTSGSMGAFDGFNKDRLDRMKEAFNSILDETTNVNIGLMRFTDPGGPILFPVKNIDGPAFQLDGSQLLVKTSTPITNADDDAEELVGVAGPGCVTATDTDFCDVHLNSLFLDLGSTRAFGRETMQTFTATDDAWAQYLPFFDIHLYYNYNFGSNGVRLNTEDIFAMRFSNFPNVSSGGLPTKNATVSFAQIDLLATANDTGTTEFKIFGAKAQDFDPLPFADSSLDWVGSSRRTGGLLFQLSGSTIVPTGFQCDSTDPMNLVGGGTESNDILCRITINNGFYNSTNGTTNGAQVTNYFNNGYNTVRYSSIDSNWTVSDGKGGNLTDAFVTWTPPSTTDGSRFESPNLGPILQEIFSVPGWQSAGGLDDLGLFMMAKGPGDRSFQIREQGSSRAPRMTAAWVEAGANTKQGEVLVGLRFQNVQVPRGATLSDTSLELYPNGRYYSAAETTGNPLAVDNPISLEISAETNLSGTVGAPAFKAEENHISNRRSLSKTVNTASYNFPKTETWDLGNPVILGGTSFKQVVKEVIDSSDWCGGKSMVLFVKVDGAANAARLIHSFDAEPSLAPVLNIDYDPTALGPGEGCIQENIVAQVNTSRGDSEENSSDGYNTYSGNVLELQGYSNGHDALVGIQFTNIQIPKGSKIIQSRIQFTSDSDTNDNNDFCTEVDIRAELTGNPDGFAASQDNISDRLSSASSPLRIKMAGRTNVPDGTKFSTVETADGDCKPEPDDVVTKDLTSITQLIVDSASWDVGKTMSFLLERVSGIVKPSSYDRSATNAPTLFITAQINKGDVPEPEQRSATVREVMRDLVGDLNHDGYTPIVDTLYEAYLYYAGKPVDYGRERGYFAGSNTSSVQRSTRVSHELSYTDGRLNRPGGCTDGNLNADACRQEQIQTTPTAPTYLSPIKDQCGEQNSYVVLLTDGLANRPHSEQKIKDMVRGDGSKIASCLSTFPSGGNISSGEKCGLELVEFTATEDLNTNVEGTNTVITHTVGFAIAPGGERFLKEAAKLGGGSYVEASSAEQLTDEFRRFIQEAKDKPTVSFAAPAVSVNAFNKLYTDKDVYFSYFEPSASASWLGNVKRYRLCTSELVTSEGCILGELLDTNLEPILERDPTTRDQLRVRRETLSFWSAGQPDLVPGAVAGQGYDGGVISVGGAGGQLRATNPNDRRVFTNLDTSVATTHSYFSSDSNPGRSLDELNITSTRPSGVLDGLTGPNASTTTKELLNMAGAPAADIDEMVDWIRGSNVDGVALPTDTSVKSTRYALHDPLHTSPIAITYGEASDADSTPITKILVATNGGAVHMLNGESGKEEWAFYPQAMLANQKILRENAGTGKLYGLDGSIRTWIYDKNQDGTIDPSVGDFVRMYVGMRRGGTYYYALDITPGSALTDAATLSGISPKLMWRIHGGGPDGVYARLGQTWSPPQIETVNLGGATAGEFSSRIALIVGGGYEDGQDNNWGPVASAGNAVYIIDARTGERLFFASSAGISAGEHSSSGTNDHVVYSGLDCAVPTRIAALDMNRDNAVDRLYFGDNCAKLHRIDLAPKLGENESGMSGIIGTLAILGSNVADTDKRKIQFAPDLIPVRGALAFNTAGADYDLLVTVTGDRAKPLDELVVNFAYGLRDFHVDHFQDTNNDKVADNYPIGGVILGKILGDSNISSTLFDVTEIQLPTGPEVPNPAYDAAYPSGQALQFQELRGADGWMIELGRRIDGIDGSSRPGEKGLASPLILGGRLFFTTFVPGGVDPTLFGLQADNAASDDNQCIPADGDGLIYALDALTGAAVINWGDVGDPYGEGQPTTVSKRWQLVTIDPPPEPVPLFLKGDDGTGEVRLLVQEKLINPGVGFPQGWTYWFQQR